MSKTPEIMGSDEESGHSLLWLLRRYGFERVSWLVGGTFVGGVGRFVQRLSPVLVGIAIDALLLGEESFQLPVVPDAWVPTELSGQLVLTVGLLTAAYGTEVISDYLSRRLLGRYNQEFQHDIRTEVYDTVQRLEMGFFDETDTGRLMSVLRDDVQELNSFVYGVVNETVSKGTLAASAYVYMFWLNWQLAAVSLVVPLVLGVLSDRFSELIQPKHRAVRQSAAALNSRLNDNIDGISVIKAFGTETAEQRRVADVSSDHRSTQWSAHWLKSSADPVMQTVSQGASLLTILIGGVWVISGPPLFFSGTLTPGELFTFYVFTGSLVTAMESLTNIVDSYQNSRAAAARLRRLAAAEGLEDRSETPPLSDPAGAVEYDDVSFTYGSREEPSLQNVSLDVSPGERVAVVGPTGAGKSTVIKLLLRFYDPDDGVIRIDGRDVREIPTTQLRSLVGYVPQEPFLFHGTVRENIAYADPDCSEEAVTAAARRAGADEFVNQLPDGYDTVVGERGVKLSGGQRQRIAIARALLSDPEILVLDEATSHVDNETEELIQQTLADLATDRTTFAIAHRLSTVTDADQILVLDDGRVTERGTHEELLEADGLYANLWRVQVGDVQSLPESFLNRARRGEAA